MLYDILEGVQSHIDAIANGEYVEHRSDLIRKSNFLSIKAKEAQIRFINSFCWMSALYPYSGQRLILEPGVIIHFNRRREDVEGNEVPGIRVGGPHHELIIQGELYRHGKRLAHFDFGNGVIGLRWPIAFRDVPARGCGPWQNFLPQVVRELAVTSHNWPEY